MNNKKLFVLSSAALLTAVTLIASSGVSVLASSAASDEPDPNKGVVIVAVDSEGPAAQAGIVRGDILQQIDGQHVDTIIELQDVLDGLEPDDDVELVVLHGDEIRTLTATLGERDGKALLGVTPSAAKLEQIAFTVVKEDGVAISEVLPGSPAEKAGLKEGDVILSIDGEEIASGSDLAEAIASSEPGDVIIAEVDTGDDEGVVELEIMLSEHPDDKDIGYLGVRFSRIPRVRTSELPFGMPPFERRERVDPRGFHTEPFEPYFIQPGEVIQGALVLRVAEDSPAAEAGLKLGDFIRSVNGESVEDMESLKAVLAQYEPGDDVTLTVRSPMYSDDEDRRDVDVTLGQHPDDEDTAYLGVTVGSVEFGRYEGDSGSNQRTPLWRQFELDSDSRLPRNEDRGFRWFPEWDLDLNLPFNLDSLRERLGEPRLFQFDWTPGQEAGAESSDSASASA